jgi:hypothetical protein
VSRLKHSTEVAISTAAVEMVREKNDRITTLERELAEARKEAAGLREALGLMVKETKALFDYVDLNFEEHEMRGHWTPDSFAIAQTKAEKALSTPTAKHFVSVDEVKALVEKFRAHGEDPSISGDMVNVYDECAEQLRKLVEESK